jgi:hypothetical protein
MPDVTDEQTEAGVTGRGQRKAEAGDIFIRATEAVPPTLRVVPNPVSRDSP